MAAIIVRQQRISRIAAKGITTLRVLVDRSLASAGGPGAGTVLTTPVTVETASILLPQITLYETATAPDIVTQGAIYCAELLDINGFIIATVPGFAAFNLRIPATETTWNEIREANDFLALIQSSIASRLGLDTFPSVGQSIITVIGAASNVGLDTISLLFGSSINPPGIRRNIATAQMEFSHDGLTWSTFGAGGGSGTVTSVGLSLPSIFSVSGSPVTVSGTLTAALANQTANLIFAGPTSGGAAAPTFRTLVANDYVTMIGDSGAGGTKGAVPAPAAGDAAANKFLKADGAWTAIPSAPVTSVFGRTGAVVATSGDYNFSQISGSVADGQLSVNVTLLGNTVTGTGAIVLTNSPTLVTPTIASFANANHSHADAAGGGQLNATNIFNAGTIPVARLPLLVGDSGAGGTAGLAPAPAAGDAAANKFLKADGTWAAAGSSSGANPTASVGLAAVNGVAVTFMRSDAAPALDQAITPTWTGQHIHSLNNAAAWAIGQNGNTNPVVRVATNTASQADGVLITGLGAGNGTTLAALSSGANSFITLTPKGTGVNKATSNSNGDILLMGSNSSYYWNDGGSGPSLTLALATNRVATLLSFQTRASISLMVLPFSGLIGFGSWSNFAEGCDVGLVRAAAGVFRINDGSTSGNKNSTAGSLLIGTDAGVIGSAGKGILAFSLSTAPTSSPADTVQLYSGDAAAGDHQLYSRDEAGEVNRLTGLGARVSTQFDKTSDTTLANVTGLTRNVEAGRVYSFTVVLYTTSNVAGGVKAAIGGTATATSIIYEAEVKDGSTIATMGTARTTTLGNTVGDVTTVTAARIVITGTIAVNAAGTLTVQFAQNASNGAASSVLVNSSFNLYSLT